MRLVADDRMAKEGKRLLAHSAGLRAHESNLPVEALAAFGEALEICSECDWTFEAAESTFGIACTLSELGRFHQSARFLGLTRALRAERDFCPGEAELKEVGRLVALLRVRLGNAAFHRQVAHGSEMSLETACRALRSRLRKASLGSLK